MSSDGTIFHDIVLFECFSKKLECALQRVVLSAKQCLCTAPAAKHTPALTL